MVKVEVINLKAKKSGRKTRVALPEEVFRVKANEKLVAQYVRVYLANQRQGTVKTKSRGEVSGSGKKIWQQKHTGRARHGDRYAPIFVGGGVAHGPVPKDWSLKMSKKMRKRVLFGALSDKTETGWLIVVDGLNKVKGRTKEMVKIIANLKAQMAKGERKKRVLMILPEVREGVMRAGRNIPYLSIVQARQLNAYEVLRAGLVVIEKEAVKVIEETFLKTNSKGKT